MEKQTCECGKVIEGYSKEHTNYLMSQHQLSKEHIEFMKNKKKKK